MAILNVPSITINGSSQIFGGQIFSLDLELPVEITSAPAEISIGIVSQDKATYVEPNLTSFNPYTIVVGDIFQAVYYAIELQYRDSTDGGKALYVTFVDESYILDTYWVGLHNKMGNKNGKGNPDSLILVGNEVHPCDINEDGVFDSKDVALINYDQQQDQCELLCPQRQNGSTPIEEICKDKEVTQLFDVTYSFDQLLAALKAKRIPITKTPGKINTDYFARYTGKLRNVLENWCSDFGWTFVWKRGLYFIDCRQRPKVNLQSFSNLKSLSVKKSMRNTVSRGAITYYGQPGVIGQTDCTKSESYLLHCLTLRELFGDFYTPNKVAMIRSQGDLASTGNTSAGSSSNVDLTKEYKDDVYPNGVPILSFEAFCVCSFFNETVRNLYAFYKHYNLVSDSAAIAAKNKSLDRLGRMKIYEVFSNGAPQQQRDIYTSLLDGSFTIDDRTIFSNDTEKNNFINNGGYFALVAYDEELMQRQYEIEQHLASEFMGQHWIRPFQAPFVGENPQVVPQGTYYASLSTDLNQIPFSQFQHTYNGYVGRLLNTYLQVQNNNFKAYNYKRFGRSESQQRYPRLLRSFIYMNKNPVWNPTKVGTSDFASIVKNRSSRVPREFPIDGETLQQNFPTYLTPDKINPSDIKYVRLMAFFPDSFTINSQVVTHPQEEGFFYRDDGTTIETYGLTSKQTVRYNILGIPVYLPAAASVQFSTPSIFSSNIYLSRTNTAGEQSVPSYKVLVTATKNNRGIIPKIETTYIAPPQSNRVLSVEYTLKDLDKQNLKYLLSPSIPLCTVNQDTLLQYHKTFNSNLNFDVTEPFESYEYELIGVTLPNGIDISDGLEGINITINESTVSTKIKIGNSFFRPPSQEYLLSRFLFEQSQFIKNSQINPI